MVFGVLLQNQVALRQLRTSITKKKMLSTQIIRRTNSNESYQSYVDRLGEHPVRRNRPSHRSSSDLVAKTKLPICVYQFFLKDRPGALKF